MRLCEGGEGERGKGRGGAKILVVVRMSEELANECHCERDKEYSNYTLIPS